MFKLPVRQTGISVDVQQKSGTKALSSPPLFEAPHKIANDRSSDHCSDVMPWLSWSQRLRHIEATIVKIVGMLRVESTERRMFGCVPSAISQIQTAAKSHELPIARLFWLIRRDVSDDDLLMEGEETGHEGGPDDLVRNTAQSGNDSGLNFGVSEKRLCDLVAGVHEAPDTYQGVASRKDLIPDHEQDGDPFRGLELEQFSERYLRVVVLFGLFIILTVPGALS